MRHVLAYPGGGCIALGGVECRGVVAVMLTLAVRLNSALDDHHTARRRNGLRQEPNGLIVSRGPPGTEPVAPEAVPYVRSRSRGQKPTIRKRTPSQKRRSLMPRVALAERWNSPTVRRQIDTRRRLLPLAKAPQR